VSKAKLNTTTCAGIRRRSPSDTEDEAFKLSIAQKTDVLVNPCDPQAGIADRKLPPNQSKSDLLLPHTTQNEARKSKIPS
jgi:hypothetical protein